MVLTSKEKDAHIYGPLLVKKQIWQRKWEKTILLRRKDGFNVGRKERISASSKHIESKGKPILVRYNRDLKLNGQNC